MRRAGTESLAPWASGAAARSTSSDRPAYRQLEQAFARSRPATISRPNTIVQKSPWHIHSRVGPLFTSRTRAQDRLGTFRRAVSPLNIVHSTVTFPSDVLVIFARPTRSVNIRPPTVVHCGRCWSCDFLVLHLEPWPRRGSPASRHITAKAYMQEGSGHNNRASRSLLLIAFRTYPSFFPLSSSHSPNSRSTTSPSISHTPLSPLSTPAVVRPAFALPNPGRGIVAILSLGHT